MAAGPGTGKSSPRSRGQSKQPSLTATWAGGSAAAAARQAAPWSVSRCQEVDRGQLSLLAEAGGTATSGSAPYFQADDAPGLGLALGEIARAADACELAVSPDPRGVEDQGSAAEIGAQRID